MKKTFRENVFICEDFSLNRKENKLRRKYEIFGGSTEKNKDSPILKIEQNGWFHYFLILILFLFNMNLIPSL